jgi:hypothetical protein
MTLLSLAKDPRKYAAELKVCTRDLASILVTAYHPNGLLDIGIVDTDAEFRAAHPDVIPDEGGVAAPAPRSICIHVPQLTCCQRQRHCRQTIFGQMRQSQSRNIGNNHHQGGDAEVT